MNDNDGERSRTMFQRILVPVDGSKRAERAIPVATRIARACGGAVILVRVVNAAIEFWPSLVGEPALLQSVVDEDQAAADEYLSGIKGTSELAGIPLETQIVFGEVGSAILAVAESSQADLIVLCSHGYTGMTRWALGSVAEKVAADTDVAEAIVRVAENGEGAEGAGVFRGCDVIAMVTHGRSGIRRWEMGSITERVLHATKLPLLIVRPANMMDKSKVMWDESTLAAIEG